MANTPSTPKPNPEEKPDTTGDVEKQAEGNQADAAEPKTKYLQFDPAVVKTLSGTEHQISKTQLVEAGIQEPFTNKEQAVAIWNPRNEFRVPASQFTDKAIARLVQEPDIKLVEV